MRKLCTSDPEPLRAQLAKAAHQSADWRSAHRLHAVLLVSLGLGCTQVAGWLGAHPRTVERWVQAYAKDGVAGLLCHVGGGRPAGLSSAQKAQLAGELLQPPGQLGYPQPGWSGKLLVRHLHQHYAVTLSQRQCQRLLCALCGTRHNAGMPGKRQRF